MEIKELVRPNILQLKPYASARSEFKGQADVFLDANENPYQTGLNRYPDPLQWKLKDNISVIKGVDKEQIFLGNGSDEVIDLLIRIFCEPGKDEILIMPPTYGMYKVSADIANVGVQQVSLTDAYQPDVEGVLAAANKLSKILFICHPNNPTGNGVDRHRIEQLIRAFPGIVVVDEAYIDFASGDSCINLLENNPNIVVMQTFSKAWGLAGIRLGMAFSSPFIINLLNKVKPPYNVNQLTQEAALKVLADPAQKEQWVETILAERERLTEKLMQLSFVRAIFPSETNFVMIRVDEPDQLYQYLIRQKIIVRNRSKVLKCEGCIRITVGTATENDRLLQSLQHYQDQ